MAKKIFRSVCLVSLAVFTASVIIIMWVMYDYDTQNQKTQLKRQVLQIAEGVSLSGMDYLTELSAQDYRVTYIDADGTVLYDNKSDVSTMENHKNRKEVAEALETGYGEDARYSEILTERQIYAAKRLPDGRIIRVSDTQYTVLTLFVSMLQPILIVALLAIILSVIVAYRLSDQMTPLLNRIENQQREIAFHTAELKRKQLEFEAATQYMKEGLILVNVQGVILSMNHSAAMLLKAGKYTVGKDIHTLQYAEQMTAQTGEALGVPETADYGGAAFNILSAGSVASPRCTSPTRTSSTFTTRYASGRSAMISALSGPSASVTVTPEAVSYAHWV